MKWRTNLGLPSSARTTTDDPRAPARRSRAYANPAALSVGSSPCPPSGPTLHPSEVATQSDASHPPLPLLRSCAPLPPLRLPSSSSPRAAAARLSSSPLLPFFLVPRNPVIGGEGGVATACKGADEASPGMGRRCRRRLPRC
jgi:hypothetical protein